MLENTIKHTCHTSYVNYKEHVRFRARLCATAKRKNKGQVCFKANIE